MVLGDLEFLNKTFEGLVPFFIHFTSEKKPYAA